MGPSHKHHRFSATPRSGTEVPKPGCSTRAIKVTQLAKWAMMAAIAVFGFCALLTLFMLTGPGQRMTLSLAEMVASDEESGLALGRLEGSLFSTGSIDTITLKDREGSWLKAKNVRFSWSPFALLFGRLEIDNLLVEKMDIVRSPIVSEQTSAEPTRSDSEALPAMLLVARRFELRELAVGASVLGAPARLQITANANLVDQAQGLSAKLAVNRLDGPGGKLEANLNYRPQGEQLEIIANGAEPAGGLIARLLDFPSQPPLSINFSGSGPLDKWQARWSLAASSQPFVAGSVNIVRGDGQHKVSAGFEGYLEPIVPASLSGILAGKTHGNLHGSLKDFETFGLDQFSLSSDALKLRASGGIHLERPYFFGALSARLARTDGQSVEVTLTPQQKVTLGQVDVTLSLPNKPAGRQLTAALKATNIGGAFGAISDMQMSARADQPRPKGSTAFDAHNINLNARATGLQLLDDGLTQAIGQEVAASLRGEASANEFTVSNLHVTTASSSLKAHGKMANGTISASAELMAHDLGYLSKLAGRPVSGKLNLGLAGQMATNGAQAKFSVNGTMLDLKANQPAIDGLFKGRTVAKGTIAKATDGALIIDDLTISNEALRLFVDGQSGGTPLSLNARADIRDLSKISSGLAGSAGLIAKLSGTQQDFTSQAALTGENVVLNGRDLVAPKLTFSSRGSLQSHFGIFQLKGQLDQQPVFGTAEIGYAPGAISLDNIKIAVATAKVEGGIKKPAQGNAIGKLIIDLPRLADLSAFIGQPMEGALKGAVIFAKEQQSGEPVIRLSAAAPAMHVGENKLRNIDLAGEIRNYVEAMRINAKVQVANVQAPGLRVQDLRLDAQDIEGKTRFRTFVTVNDHKLNLKGHMASRSGTYDLQIADATVRKGKFSLQLDPPARLFVEPGDIAIKRLIVKADGGRTKITGSAGAEKIDLIITPKNLPARIANLFDETLGLEGKIDGTINVQGRPSAPHGAVKIIWRGAAASLSRAQGLPPVNINVEGKFVDQAINGKVRVGGVDGLKVTATGGFGVRPKSPIKMQIAGLIPLSLANGPLATRATRFKGTAKLSANVAGTFSAPDFAGKIAISNASINDPASGIKLIDVAGAARFTPTALTLDKITGKSAKGGKLAARGTLSLTDSGSMSTDVSVDLAGLKFDDRQLMSGEVDGRLAIKGAVERLNAEGKIRIKRLDITVPNALPRSVTNLDLRHVNAPKHIRKNGDNVRGKKKTAAPATVNLNLVIDAAKRIFVRGRGVDARLGGRLHIHGSAERPAADGGFNMEHGRLLILGRTLDFTRGKIIFDGSVEPLLDMSASADADGVTITVLVTGPASSPVFKFSSIPELPEDEVIARLLFNKSLAGLSPIQLAQLAGEVDKIGGLSSGPSIFDRIKSSLGVDVLDVTTDKKGGTAVSVGSYLNEKTYIGVRQGGSPDSSRVVIDHDLTKSLKARGEVGADGNSKIGVGVEWDY